MPAIPTILLLASAAQTPAASTSVMVTPPTPSVRQGGIAGASPYPAEALRLKQEGQAVLMLLVTAKGRVDSCAVAQSSGSNSLDAASCATARKVRFDAARDAQGHAIEGEARFPMSWHLPSN